MISAFHEDDSGSAYVFKLNGDTWTEQAKLLASDGAAGDYFGFSVDIIGDTIVAGAYGDDDNGESSGSVYVYSLSENALPSWGKGNKSGWDGSTPPGLNKKDKTPAGFDKGNKNGWDAD